MQNRERRSRVPPPPPPTSSQTLPHLFPHGGRQAIPLFLLLLSGPASRGRSSPGRLLPAPPVLEGRRGLLPRGLGGGGGARRDGLAIDGDGREARGGVFAVRRRRGRCCHEIHAAAAAANRTRAPACAVFGRIRKCSVQNSGKNSGINLKKETSQSLFCLFSISLALSYDDGRSRARARSSKASSRRRSRCCCSCRRCPRGQGGSVRR